MSTMQAAFEAGDGTALAGLDTWLVVEARIDSAPIQALREAVAHGLDAVMDAIVDEGLRSVGSFAVATRVTDGFRVTVRGTATALVTGEPGTGDLIAAETGTKWTERTVSGAAVTLALTSAPDAHEAPGARSELTSDAAPVAASRLVVRPPAPVAEPAAPATGGSAPAVSSATPDGAAHAPSHDGGDDGDEDSSAFDSFFMPTMQGRPSLAHLVPDSAPSGASTGAAGGVTQADDDPTSVMSAAPSAAPSAEAGAGWQPAGGPTADPGRTLLPGEHPVGSAAGPQPWSLPPQVSQPPQPPHPAAAAGPAVTPDPTPGFRPAPPPPPIPSWTPPPAAHAAPPPAGAIIDSVPDFGGWGVPTGPAPTPAAPPVSAPQPPTPSVPLAPPAPVAPVPTPPPAQAPPLPGPGSGWQPQAPPQAPPSPPAYASNPPTPAPSAWSPAPAARPAPDPNRTVNRAALRAGAGGASQAAPPQVQAAQCSAGHLSPAHAAVCRVCRIPMPPNPPVFWTPRPVLGRLVCSNGEVFVLDRGLVLGRAPVVPEGHQGDAPNLVKLVDPTLELSSQHLEIRLDHWMVLAVDLGSTNGSDVRAPGREPVRLVPGMPELLEPGTVVSLADVLTLTFEVW